ncbi:uncharacterized protein LOC117116563 [Anneissia japonica]|uniref:uncharacterized protein LOC117116563 n=1 Tax=Anneissia japonica TaxID=1529436 RepID=UPI00142580D9|nr:uncharacterized protein LOC117116563 [Anneissia japonica]
MSDEEDVEAESAEEVGFKEYLKKDYDMSRGTLYNMMFADNSEFYLSYIRARKCTEISIDKWKMESGKEKRLVSYRYHLKKKVKKSSSQVTEIQKRDPSKDIRNCHVIENEVQNKGVMYADSFHILERWTITDIDDNKCNLSVHAEIVFHKVNKMIRSIIKKKVRSGLKEAYAILDSLLVEASQAGLAAVGLQV